VPTVTITGGSGYIGSALSERLAKQFEVRILDTKRARQGNAEFVPCDVRNCDEVERAISDTDLVIHAAIIQIPQINENKKLGYEVNILGTHNVCEAVQRSERCKGLILVSSWHTMGEREIVGLVDEKFGLRPDMVEERARAYALSKMGQEAIVRLYDESANADRVYGLIRIGTTLGENMPAMTAANIFINKALKGEALTPYEHSMHRPMLYVDIVDVCRAFKSYANGIISKRISQTGNSLDHIANVYYPEPITIYELAENIRESVRKCSGGNIDPKITVMKTNEPEMFTCQSKQMMKFNLHRSKALLGLDRLTDPRDTIARIIRGRMTQRPI
jgi:nucleoside-diphosphate-sugar epimerase